MNEHPFQYFINLIDFDQSIRASDFQVHQLQKDIDELLQEEDRLEKQLVLFKQNAIDQRKVVDDLELEISSLDQLEKDKRLQLENAIDHKMYQSLKREAERIRFSQHELEEALLVAWNKLEFAQKELKEQQQTIDEKITLMRKEKEQKRDAREKLLADIKKLYEQRPAKESQVPADWLEKYAHMKASVDDPVVPVLRGGCSACFYTISNQDMLRLQRKALVQCKGCFRLLYSPEAMEQEAH